MAGDSRKIPQSVFGRTSRLLLSTAKIATREVAGRLVGEESRLATKIRQTEELVATLGQLKGAAMKAGQILSLELSDVLPPEVVQVLRQLHDSSSFMPFDQVRYILGRELGADKLANLEDLTPNPIAAASIGQVHRARIGGEAVAVKIQFPGVAKGIDADLAVLRRVANIWLQMQGRDVDLDAFFTTIANGLKCEVDYRQELENAERYRASLVSRPHFVVPRVWRDYSSEHVLCLSFEDGMRIADFIQSSPTPAQVEHFGGLLLELVITELYTNGMMQTDPNYGNFLYRPKDGRLVLLDFGATSTFSIEFRLRLREMLRLLITNDLKQVIVMGKEHGLISERESPEAIAALLDLLVLLRRIFNPDAQPLAFRDDRWLKELREKSIKVTQVMEHTPPPSELLFLNRKLSGMFHLLKDLNAVIDMRPFYEMCIKTPIE